MIGDPGSRVQGSDLLDQHVSFDAVIAKSQDQDKGGRSSDSTLCCMS